MNFIDFCSGIGGFRYVLEKQGHKCIAFADIGEKQRAAYKAMYDTENEVEWSDITTISDNDFRLFRGKTDIICGGFPCQPFSQSNSNRKGFEDTRGTVFFDICRAVKEVEPKYVFFENVKGLLNDDKGRTFRTIICKLDELGYDVEWQIINSKHHGSAQNRERVYIIGHRRPHRNRPIFPIGKTTDGILKSIQADTSGKGYKSQQDRFYRIDGIMCTLPHARAKTKCCVVDDVGNLMILTAIERMRLQGFPDYLTEKALSVVSENDLCEMAGNSVTVNVIEQISMKIC
ncbi:DNA cytosine methyltransferase [Lysinibacillus irui]|uniref:DNA cytosine methyltransferase n=1 Tax=Lysinibacillus irui TaxID=2998077 RepID=UPI002AD38A6C|nr:DNA (cytosine-5-)-methyltransferase [Lysinibacillus irui]MEA0564074.1 DNA (cytosine-5-)-methyltransferase [Lysinibacillus irui]